MVDSQIHDKIVIWLPLFFVKDLTETVYLTDRSLAL